MRSTDSLVDYPLKKRLVNTLTHICTHTDAHVSLPYGKDGTTWWMGVPCGVGDRMLPYGKGNCVVCGGGAGRRTEVGR